MASPMVLWCEAVLLLKVVDRRGKVVSGTVEVIIGLPGSHKKHETIKVGAEGVLRLDELQAGENELEVFAWKIGLAEATVRLAQGVNRATVEVDDSQGGS